MNRPGLLLLSLALGLSSVVSGCFSDSGAAGGPVDPGSSSSSTSGPVVDPSVTTPTTTESTGSATTGSLTTTSTSTAPDGDSSSETGVGSTSAESSSSGATDGSTENCGNGIKDPGEECEELAWQRLSSQHAAAHTLVATGTGSGKTEWFLYPMLDHCARARQAGEGGIKALVIYPMNALATDQARRIAELVASVPAFAGLRVGLYVGGNTSNSGEGMVITPTGVITDRDTMRQHPPDILLTNYKMLDYLMLRPRDRQLWAHNTPTTLRYMVLDELHTFDGAQGTDLALLLRRLRAPDTLAR